MRSTEAVDSREGGNKRYVGFVVVGEPPERSLLIHLLNRCTRKDEPRPWLSYYEGGGGVIRCTDRNRDTIMEMLERAEKVDGRIKLVPVLTSGSICKVKAKVQKELAR